MSILVSYSIFLTIFLALTISLFVGLQIMKLI